MKMFRACLLALLCASLVPAQAQDAGALRARHAALQKSLADNPFGRALHVESTTGGGLHKGEIHAVIGEPFRVVAPALTRAGNWCEILTLQVNIKRCTASDGALVAHITRKPRDPVDSAHRIEFSFERAAAAADYVQVALRAPSGPMGTRDYEIRIEAAPLDSGRTFLHLSYTYTLGAMARFAMEAYLMGPGRDKRGFSVDGGERGVVERNAMRHYLAIDAYLASLGATPTQRLETRLRRWHAAVSQYPQLREVVGPDEYVEMKRREAAAATG